MASSPKPHVRLPMSRPGTVRSGSLTPRNTSRERLLNKINSMASRPTSPERTKRTGRGRTARQTGRSADDLRGRAGNTSEEDLDGANVKLPLLEKDISITMRTRAERGYGLDPVRNRKICRDNSSLVELWSWIEHSAVMSEGGRAFVDNFDFGFMGVLPLLKGFSPHKVNSSPADRPHYNSHQRESSAASKRSRTVSQPSGPTVFEDVRSSIKRSDAARAQDMAFAKATVALNKKNGSTPFTVSSHSTGKAAQRQLALSSIGPDFASADISAVIKKYQQTNEPSKAAAWALFSGNTELAVKSLRSNKGKHTCSFTESQCYC